VRTGGILRDLTHSSSYFYFINDLPGLLLDRTAVPLTMLVSIKFSNYVFLGFKWCD